ELAVAAGSRHPGWKDLPGERHVRQRVQREQERVVQGESMVCTSANKSVFPAASKDTSQKASSKTRGTNYPDLGACPRLSVHTL
ncbi:MAG TPA: hypothetical protein V6C97_16295, partial [Oculatellaceae cyanobacterium]